MRNRILHTALLTITLAAAASAQGRWGQGPNDWSRDWSRGDARYGRSVDPVSASMRDLSNIFRRARVDDHEADHFRRALDSLDRFQDRAARGRFDRGALDRAIDNMHDLARARQLHPRDRQVIASRIQDLRFLRDRGDRAYFDYDRRR